jgi:hypothetical protein
MTSPAAESLEGHLNNARQVLVLLLHEYRNHGPERLITLTVGELTAIERRIVLAQTALERFRRQTGGIRVQP